MSLNNRNGMSFVRLPADSAGKRLGTSLYQALKFTNATYTFVVGDYVVGQTSNAVGEIVAVYYTGVTSGFLYVQPEDPDNSEAFNQFSVGEIINVDGAPAATLSEVTDYHYQNFMLTGKNNPAYGQHVDKDGSAFIRFTEGQQQLDAYGLSRFAQPMLVAAYSFDYDIENEDFTTLSGSGGSSTYDTNQGAIVLSVNNTSGSHVSYTSNVYYPSFPGAGQYVQLAVSVGDSGKSGCVRRWGYYDTLNGIFFELSGTQLYVVERSNVTGQVVESRVSQSLWNTEKVNDVEEMLLDVTKANIYWFNMQNLIGGRVVYGIVDEAGVRKVVHNDVDINTTAMPSVRITNLPFRIEMFNDAATAGSSEMRLFAATIRSEGINADDWVSLARRSAYARPSLVAITGSAQVPIMTFRSGDTFKTLPNRILTVTDKYSVHVSGSAGQAIVFRMIKNGTLNSSSFSVLGSNTPLEGDVSATSVTGGREIFTKMYAPGTYNEEFPPQVFNFRNECMSTRLGAAADIYTITAQKVNATGSDVYVGFAGNWSDIG